MNNVVEVIGGHGGQSDMISRPQRGIFIWKEGRCQRRRHDTQDDCDEPVHREDQLRRGDQNMSVEGEISDT